jgi:tetratricopeptide (TPR) repeat protein
MATARYTVVYESSDGTRYKLCRVLLTEDGSYFVTVPYHRSEKVWLSRRRLNYPNPNAVAEQKPLEVALLDDDDHRLKLAHHADGLVQFSGHGIVSGLDESGQPRGMGLRSFPLTRPTSGPACGITIMNPVAFKQADQSRTGDIVFRERQLFSAPTDTGLVIEVFYFAGLWRRFIYEDIDGPVIWLRHPSGALLKLRVCMSPGEAWAVGFVGIDAWAAPIKLGASESGFVLNSPSALRGYNERGELEGEALYAAYPPVEDLEQDPRPLAFPRRDDPPYREGGPSPSSDPLPARRPTRGNHNADLATQVDPLRVKAIIALENAQTLSEQGNQTGARILLERVVALGSSVTFRAQYALGRVCSDLGDVETARNALGAASRSGDPDIAPLAAYELGHLLQQTHRSAAKAAYSRAISLGHPEIGPKAAVNLGILLAEDGDADGARQAFQSAVDSGHPEQRSKALTNLATLILSEGDIAAAALALDEAISVAHPDVAPRAQMMRGDLYRAHGDTASARDLYVKAVESGHPIFSSQASLRLGEAHQAGGELDAARAAYERALRLGAADVRATAQDALDKLPN